MKELATLLREVRRCELCAEHLPHGPRPVLSAHEEAPVLVIGQAPGSRVHASGVPWEDPSGDRLRAWLGLSRDEFYDRKKLALVPMGFCYPGRGRSGDLPPRPECAPRWHEPLLARMPRVRLTLLLGRHAIGYYLRDRVKGTLTDTVKSWREYRPAFVPLPHPSPRNNVWLQRNPWFEQEVVPYLRRRVARVLRG